MAREAFAGSTGQPCARSRPGSGEINDSMHSGCVVSHETPVAMG